MKSRYIPKKGFEKKKKPLLIKLSEFTCRLLRVAPQSK